MKSICFVGIDNYPVLNPAYGGEKIGGESVQQTLLAKEFVRRGYEVSMVVKDYGQPQDEVIDGIRCIKSYRDGCGLPVLRFIYPKLYTLWQALSSANADVYYQSCASFLTGLTAAYARSHEKMFLFRIAHDTDCIPGEHLIRYKRDVKIYEYGLRNASVIYSQSQYQKDLLIENYGLDSVVLDMLVEGETEAEKESEKDIDVLWVNNIRPFKRPDRLLELAKTMPETNFVVIGGPGVDHRDYYDSMKRQADTMPNVNFMGPVPYAEIGSFFSRAKVFVNTSDSEGFPNTFLQSWVRGVPVLSFFDPDDIIAREGLGFSPESLEDMAATIRGILSGETDLSPIAANARRYIQRNHSAEGTVDVYLEGISAKQG